MPAKIEVEGLKDFQRALKDAGGDFPKELRLASKEAAKVVATGTRQSFLSRAGVAPKVAASVKVLASQRGAAVRIGGNKFPYALGSNFGSVRFRRFPMFAGHGSDYSLYKTIKAKRDEVIEVYGEAVDRIARKAFPT